MSSDHRPRLRTQFQKLMALWWQCVEKSRVKKTRRRAIEMEFEEIAATIGTDFYPTPPPHDDPSIFLPLVSRKMSRATILRSPDFLGSIDSMFRKRLKERGIEQQQYAQTLFRDLGEFEYASIPRRITPVALATDQDVVRLLKPITSNEGRLPSLHNVQFSAECQRAVATDGHILVALPWHVTRTTYVLHRDTGAEMDEQYPNWPAVIPITATVQSVPLTLERLMGRIQGLVNLSRLETLLPSREQKQGVWGRIRIGNKLDITFNALLLARAVTVLLKAGVRSVVLRGTTAQSPLLLVDEEDAGPFAVVMPVRNDGGVPVGAMVRIAVAADTPDFGGLSSPSSRTSGRDR